MIEISIDLEHAILIPEATDREVAMLSPVLSAMREAKRDADRCICKPGWGHNSTVQRDPSDGNRVIGCPKPGPGGQP